MNVQMQSPMLTHALESFEHGLEHYIDGTSRSRKFALLHLDQAIELLLKEKCVRLGKSIYKNDGTTLTIHEAFSSLKKADVASPEQPRLEELHDLRNTIQHKGLVPDDITTRFHVGHVYGFVKRFVSEELGLKFEDILPARYMFLIEGVSEHRSADEVDDADLKSLGIALREAWDAENPTSQIVSAYAVLRQATYLLAGTESGDSNVKFRSTIRNTALSRGISESRVDKKLKMVLMLRGLAMKQDHETTEREGLGYLRATEAILKYVGFEKVVAISDAVA